MERIPGSRIRKRYLSTEGGLIFYSVGFGSYTFSTVGCNFLQLAVRKYFW